MANVRGYSSKGPELDSGTHTHVVAHGFVTPVTEDQHSLWLLQAPGMIVVYMQAKHLS